MIAQAGNSQAANSRMQASIRWTVLLLGSLLVISSLVPLVLRAFAADEGARVQLNFSNAAPRTVEDSTQNAIGREYAAAWKNLAEGLANDDLSKINASFVGAAHDRFADQIAQQQKAGLKTKYVDRGHNVNAVFYSPEGSAMELRDTADLEIQVLDGGKVVHSEQVKKQFVAILTVAEGRWKVRVLEEVP